MSSATATKLTSLPEPEVFDFPFEQKSLSINGRDWNFRELTVEENDSCAEAAKQPDGGLDGRVMMRLMIVKSSVEPKLSIERLAKLPNKVYLRFARVVNDLNAPDLEGDEGND